jgi:rsbT co-antagonist protein RsbR
MLQEVSALLESKKEEFRDHSVKEMQESRIFAGTDPQVMEAQSRAFYDAYIRVIRSGNYETMRVYAKNIARSAPLSNVRVDQILTYILMLRDISGMFIFEAYSKDPEKIKAAIPLFTPIGREVLSIVTGALVDEFESTIRQQESMMKLSTPIVEVWEGIAMIPLIGVLDSARAKQLTVKVLERVASAKTDVIVMDISGITAIDTKTANYMLTTVRSVKLMGADMVIAGIRPDVATTMVTLGIDLTGIVTMRTLREGLEYGFKKMRFKVTNSQ